MKPVFGHEAQMAAFGAAVRSGKMHHGWLFSGPKGIGKASFAATAASMLTDPDGQFHNLSKQRTHPDIFWIERLLKEPPKEGEEARPNAEKKRSIAVDQIRELQQKLTKRPTLGDKRVIIIDSVDDLERGGANALLKSLEEPPVGSYFILISHASDRLLPTIRSRCRMLRFGPLGDADMRMALSSLDDISSAEMDAVLPMCNGAPGQALRILGLEMAALEQKIDQILQKGDGDNSIRSQLAEALNLKSAHERYEVFLRRVPVRIAEHARGLPPLQLASAVDAFHAADQLASRALALSLDKPAVIFEMGSLLASLQTHMHAAS